MESAQVSRFNFATWAEARGLDDDDNDVDADIIIIHDSPAPKAAAPQLVFGNTPSANPDTVAGSCT